MQKQIQGNVLEASPPDVEQLIRYSFDYWCGLRLTSFDGVETHFGAIKAAGMSILGHQRAEGENTHERFIE